MRRLRLWRDPAPFIDPRLDRILLSPRATARVPQLSPREREIMHLMAEGRTAEAIGQEINVSVETVRTHAGAYFGVSFW